MSHPDITTDPAAFGIVDDAAADDPFTALRYHFGMLLGVDDFETEQAYHRAKLRLHQGWLHGPGVLWGLAVTLDAERSELRVQPGLALDGAGRELHLDAPACLDPRAWYDKHPDIETLQPPPDGADVAFDAHIQISWASCLTRPVPALAEPCEDARVETAHSRIWETVGLRLLPGLADEPADRYRCVRILLGLLAPATNNEADQQAAQARDEVLAAADADRAAAALGALRAMANADAIDLAPPHDDDAPRSLTPLAPPAPVVLANLRIALRRRTDEGEGWELAGGDVDLLPRRSHIASETVQELTAAALAAARDGAPAPAGPHVTDVTHKEEVIELALSGPLEPSSVRPDAFSVTFLTDDGWKDIAIKEAAHDGDGPAVTLTLATVPCPPWRLVARGSGSAPLVDAELNALNDGRDFVYIERNRR